MELWSAFLIGLFGSLHCVGMCGPIVLALPDSSAEKVSFYAGRLMYNLGRIITYSFLGLIFGLMGSGIAMAGFQQSLSVALGIIIIAAVLISFLFKNKLQNNAIENIYTSKIKLLFSKFIGRETNFSMLMIGILSGFLPCGLVYVAIAGAVVTASAAGSAMLMASFGFGTLPLMFAASLFGKFVSINLRRKLNRLIPVLAGLLALILILRGLNLGIPYVSPKLKTSAQMINADCCSE